MNICPDPQGVLTMPTPLPSSFPASPPPSLGGDLSSCDPPPPFNPPPFESWFFSMPTVNSNPYWEYLPTHAISNLPKNAPCGAALPVGNTVNGSTGKNDTIAAVNQVWVVYDGMSQIVGYVYTTGGGQQYFQLAGSFDLSGSVGIGFAAIGVGYSNVAPIIPWNGSLTSAIGTIINLSGFAGKSFVGYSAPIFNAIMAGKGTVKTWQC